MHYRQLRVVAMGAGLVLALGFSAALAQEVVSDMASLNAEASKMDPDDYKYMQPVCTQCHTPAFFLHSRTWSEWQDIFNQMSGYGAQATPEQWIHIKRFLARNLTLINVNHADEDELSAVLGVDDKTAVAIVSRRADKRFTSVEDLETVPGLDKALVEAVQPRILFDQPGEDQ